MQVECDMTCVYEHQPQGLGSILDHIIIMPMGNIASLTFFKFVGCKNARVVANSPGKWLSRKPSMRIQHTILSFALLKWATDRSSCSQAALVITSALFVLFL